MPAEARRSPERPPWIDGRLPLVVEATGLSVTSGGGFDLKTLTIPSTPPPLPHPLPQNLQLTAAVSRTPRPSLGKSRSVPVIIEPMIVRDPDCTGFWCASACYEMLKPSVFLESGVPNQQGPQHWEEPDGDLASRNPAGQKSAGRTRGSPANLSE